MFRTALLEQMRKRNVPNPNQILASPNTALVAVRAYLPPLVKKGDHFDIEVRLPGNGDSTSLNGGYLLETYLSEQAIVPGRGILKGHVFAKARGSILISTGEGDEKDRAGVLRRGRVLGGGLSLKDRDMALYLRNDVRSARMAKKIEAQIGQRFYSHNRAGIREPLAKAKTDQKVEVKIHPTYVNNFPRYLQVLRHIAFREKPVARRVRIQMLKDRLMDPSTAEDAALELEAVGTEAISALKYGLKSKALESRFHAAVALAYMGEPDGVEVLAQAARDEPAFRVFALAALSTIDDPKTYESLRELINEPSAELRYGSVRTLTTLPLHDPDIRGEKIGDGVKLHVLQTTANPMVHITHKAKSEIVLLGADQKLKPPIAIRAGKHILVTAPPGSDTIIVARHRAGEPGRRKEVSTNLSDVIRTVAEFGASYPDIAQLLVQAERQNNLAGRLEIDALPRSGRLYTRPGDEEFAVASTKKARVGKTSMAPNLFAVPNDGKTQPTKSSKADDDSGTASVTDVSSLKSDSDSDSDDVFYDSGEKWWNIGRFFRKTDRGRILE
jgi:flagellar basal body P-ring protein FlgI